MPRVAHAVTPPLPPPGAARARRLRSTGSSRTVAAAPAAPAPSVAPGTTAARGGALPTRRAATASAVLCSSGAGGRRLGDPRYLYACGPHPFDPLSLRVGGNAVRPSYPLSAYAERGTGGEDHCPLPAPLRLRGHGGRRPGARHLPGAR